MSWHRIVKIPAVENIYFHYTIEAYENLGLITTLKKENGSLILECSTPLNGAVYFDGIISRLIENINGDSDV